MSHSSGSSGHSSGNGHHSNGGHQGHDSGSQGHFHYAVGDNFNPLGGYKLEHFTEGLRINNGIRFGVLFIAFFGWLYIVYWVRHHEPLTQQTIGLNAASAPTAAQDKSIVSSVSKAFPFKTSPEFGMLYAPSPQNVNKSSSYIEPNRKIPLKLRAGEALSAPINYVDGDFDERFGQPTNNRPMLGSAASSFGEPLISNIPLTNSQKPVPAGSSSINTLCTSYNVPIRNGNCVSLRTVVNR